MSINTQSIDDVLFPKIEAYSTGMLAVSQRHTIAWECSGNPDGIPVIVIHGGPGGGSQPSYRRYFDPQKWNIVQFDQRGCGQSTPYADLEENTTMHLVSDIEALREHFGIEMITVENQNNDLDIAKIEELVAADDSIKGIWVVPKYGNPTGTSVADNVVERLAKMNTAAGDFRVFWDNAYTVHHLSDDIDVIKNIFTECKASGNDDRVFIFGSTSKITFAGCGMAAIGGSEANIAWVKKHLSMSTICPDKINQVRHTRFFGDFIGLQAHMKKHAALIKPKFEVVTSILEERLGGEGLASWTNPKGGYFISLDTNEGCAKKVVALAAEAGVKLTAAGATFPYKNDPKDTNIRLAPTLPSIEEIKQAMNIVCLCIKLADMER